MMTPPSLSRVSSSGQELGRCCKSLISSWVHCWFRCSKSLSLRSSKLRSSPGGCLQRDLSFDCLRWHTPPGAHDLSAAWQMLGWQTGHDELVKGHDIDILVNNEVWISMLYVRIYVVRLTLWSMNKYALCGIHKLEIDKGEPYWCCWLYSHIRLCNDDGWWLIIMVLNYGEAPATVAGDHGGQSWSIIVHHSQFWLIYHGQILTNDS